MQKGRLSVVLGLFGLALADAPRAMRRNRAPMSGIVQDQETGEPLPGAIIGAKGATNSGVTAREGGRFSISLPVGTTTLVVRRIGYRVLEVLLPAGATSVVARMSRGPAQAGQTSLSQVTRPESLAATRRMR
jgi:hypothetical protein